MKISILTLSAFLLILVVTSCSGGRNAVMPSSADLQDTQGISKSAETSAYPGVLGAWDVTINTKDLTAEIIPARNAAAIGNIFDADLSQFLMVSPCSNCLMIGGVRIGEDDYIQLDIYIRHPFKDITKRPDLHGFDVRAIFMEKVDMTVTAPVDYMKLDGGEEDVKLNPWFVLNADGFTSHYDELPLDDRYFIEGADCPGNLNPFLRFFESYTTGGFDPMAPTGYNVMPVGSGNFMRTAVFYGGGGNEVSFYIVADVAFGQSAVLANRTAPQYYLPAFNRTEPWRMEYWLENNNLSGTDANSSTDLVVQVFDWQQQSTVDPSYPNPANPSGVPASSKVTQVILSIPEMLNENLVATVPETGDGSPSNPLQYRFQVKNEKLVDNPHAWGIIAVRDELYSYAAPAGRLPIPASPAGFPYQTNDILDYSYYGAVFINIPTAAYGDPTYKNELYLDYESLLCKANVMIQGEFFMDPSHRKFQYRWDYDYDGVTFDIDGSGLPTEYFSVPDGKTDVGLRIRTNSIPPREYIYKIPVYKEGEDFDHSISDQGEDFNMTSSRKGNSIAVIGDKICVAYTSIMTGNREIDVTVYDYKTQNVVTSRVSDGVGSCYDPVLVVIDTGPNAGIYVVFTSIQGGISNIMSTYGNPFAGGFDYGNIKTIATIGGAGAFIDKPCLVYNNDGVLTTYYHRYRTMPTTADHIRVAQSTDFAQTWTTPATVDDTTIYQTNPSATYYDRDDRYYVVWEDNRDNATRGTDLYMAYSTDGITYQTPVNISTTDGDIDETAPSIGNYDRQIGIAYLQNDGGSYRKDLYLKVLGVYGDVWTTIRVDAAVGDETFLAPSLGMANESVFAISYGHHMFSTDENSIKLVSLHQREGGWFQQKTYPEEDLGVTSLDPIDPYPAVVSQSVIDDYAIQTFIAHRSFRDGVNDDPLPFPEKFGYIDVKSIVASGN